jgi:hypothetical protein
VSLAGRSEVLKVIGKIEANTDEWTVEPLLETTADRRARARFSQTRAAFGAFFR